MINSVDSLAFRGTSETEALAVKEILCKHSRKNV